MSLIIVDEAAELKLSALQPAAVFDFVSITEGEESERFAITQKK